MMGDFHFLRPLWLLALVPAGGLGWLLWRGQDDRRAWRGVIADHLLPHLMVGKQTAAHVRPIHGLIAAWALASIALAGPTWRRQPAPFAEGPPVLVIVLKVTPSMTTPDVQPTRLARAAQKIHDLLAARGAGKAALIAYAGTAHVVLPLTADADILNSFAAELAPRVMPVEGDDPGAALALADEVIARSGQRGWALWVADGVSGPARAALAKQQLRAPVRALAVAGEGPERKSLEEAAAVVGAGVEHLTADDRDVRRLARQGHFSPTVGTDTGQGWQDAGYWLVPVLTGLCLLWFRPGWMVRAAAGRPRPAPTSEGSP